MPRYFFHIFNGKAILDDVGVELPDLDAVRREAIRASGQMLSEDGHIWSGEAWRMIVADSARTIVFSTSFSVDRHGT